MFFRSWEALGRVVLAAAAIYIVVVAALRMIGSRALAKMSGYDLIVTVALGSLVASIPLTTSISLADGVAVLITFLLLQELTRLLQTRSRRVHNVVRERPHLVVWEGKLLDDRLDTIDTTPDAVRAALRQAGLLSVADAQAVVLENDGGWSVMRRGEASDLSALEGIDVPDHGPIEQGHVPSAGPNDSKDRRATPAHRAV